MKKITLIIFCINILNSYSQHYKKNIFSIEFRNVNKKEIIELIEKKTQYRFFFQEHWLNDNKVISKKFQKSNIKEILDFVFDITNINYFIIDDYKVILTYGKLIRNSSYDLKKPSDKNIFSPLIIENQKLNVTIGKENNAREKNYYITGYIKNNKTNEKLEGVTIFEKQKNIYTTTDKNGYYRLKLPYGKNYVEVSLSGYNTDSENIILYNNGKMNFSLFEKSEQLDEIIIDATVDKNIRQTVSGITQIKAKDIKNIPQVLGERDLLKAVMTLPGIKSAGEGAEGVNVRGGKVDQNLFLLDGGVMYNPTHFLGLFSAINPFTTKSLKIYKGSIPAEFGGRLSSVFDIKSKNANTKKISGEASIGPVTGNISIETPIIKNKSGLLLGVRSTYSNWILKSLNNEKLQNSSISFYDAIAKYNHNINNNNSISVTGYYSNDTFQIASDSINNYRNTIASLNWTHKFNEKNKGNLILSNSAYDFSIDFQKKEGDRNFNLKYNINETDLKLSMNYLHSKKHSFNYGVESKLYSVLPGTINPSDNNSLTIPLNISKERGLENGVFLSDEISLNKKLSFNLGLRYSQFLALGSSKQRVYQDNSPKNTSTLSNTISYGKNEVYKTYQGLSYRLSGRYSLNNDLSIKGGVNKSFQYIHRLSNNTTASPLDTWRLSDTNILPQEGTQFSLGFFQNLNNDNYELSIEGYYKNYKNLLDYKVGANLLLNKTIETEVLQGPGKSYGIEFLLQKKLGRMNGWLSYSYSRSFIKLDSEFNEEIVNNGEFFPTNYDKPHNFDFIFNFKITQRYSLSSNFSYQTGRPITFPTEVFSLNGSVFTNYSNRNQFRIPDYYRLDLGFNIEGNHKKNKFAHTFWNISIYNVLGRNNPYSIFFETKGGNISGYKSSIFSTPIPTITFNLTF